MTPRRYQLSKSALAIVARGHPWIFRDQLSSAAHVFRDGDWLRLVDGTNAVVGYGTYEARGAIAIRIVRRGADRPDARWLSAALAAAVARRAPLRERTTAMRLVHGESDGIPAVVADRFGDVVVVASYSPGSDALARYTARWLRAEAAHVVLEMPQRRRAAVRNPDDDPGHGAPHTQADTDVARVISGAPPAVTTFVEDGLTFAVDLAGGQKTGAFLDLRGLRHAIATAPLAGARVLNLFAYTGMLGRAAEAAGAATIVQVDQSARALAFARAHHVVDAARHTFVEADIFADVPALASSEPFELVIVDPPAMTSRKSQVPAVLAAYRKLYRAARALVRPGGALVAACCTSRVERAVFHRTVREALGADFAMERELPVELDHPVAFPQADYLKIAWWRRAA